jgi:hypothetical protein
MIPDGSDPVVDEIREVRKRISARVDHDPVRLVAYYMDLQERHRDRFVRTRNSPDPGDQSAS